MESICKITNFSKENQVAALILADSRKQIKMSGTIAARLRAIGEQERLDRIGETRFANALQSVVVNPENLKKLIQRLASVNPVHLDRRAIKLNWWIEVGYLLGREIDTPLLVACFNELTPDEAKMSDAKFAAAWDLKIAAKLRASRRKDPKRCTLGSKCLRAISRQAAVVQGTGEYCSKACRGRSWAMKKAKSRETPVSGDHDFSIWPLGPA